MNLGEHKQTVAVIMVTVVLFSDCFFVCLNHFNILFVYLRM